MPGYTWPDGTKGHSITWATELQHRAAKKPQPSGGGFSSLPAQLTPAQTAFLGAHAPASGNLGGVGGSDPTPPVVTPQPYDANAANAALIANRNVALSRGESAYQTGNLGFDYGYNPDGSINTANPYSRAALYQLLYTNSKRGTTNSLANQGQLYSGAMVNAQNENDRSYAQNEANNRLAFQRAIHGVQSGQLNTFANAGTSVSDADFAATLKSVYPGS
jgi:hypothetical protein